MKVVKYICFSIFYSIYVKYIWSSINDLESIHGNIDQDIANDEHHQHQEGVHGHHEGHEEEIHTNVISMSR